MRFKIDENLPTDLVQLLAKMGLEAETVFDEGLEGRSDAEISSRCRSEQRTLITLDTDFADIRTYPPEEYAGLLVLRLHRQDKPHVFAVMERVLQLIARVPPEGKLWIIDENRVRIR